MRLLTCARTAEPSDEANPKMHVRTISAFLVWVVAAMLMINFYFRSQLILLASVAIVIIAVVVYFIPGFRKTKTPPAPA